MENTKKMYITAEEAAEMLDVSMGYAYKIIRYKWQVKVQYSLFIFQGMFSCVPSGGSSRPYGLHHSGA